MDRVNQLLQSGVISVIALAMVAGYLAQTVVLQQPVEEGYYVVLSASLLAVGIGRASNAVLNRPSAQDVVDDVTPEIQAFIERHLDAVDLMPAARRALEELRSAQVAKAPELVPGNIWGLVPGNI